MSTISVPMRFCASTVAAPMCGVQDAIWGICMENLARYLRGERLKNVVDLAKGY